MDEDIKQDRAWIEVNLENLENNINEIKKIIDDKCKIMAVVKANAYGHGMLNIATKLNEIGIKDFAVATLSEGIELRKNNIEGNILILGYTNFEDIEYVIKNVKVLVNDEYAEIIGRICMDQLVIDATKIPNIKQGDIVTLIGGEKEISVEEISSKSDTITNELLCRLGNRLERVSCKQVVYK